MDKAVHAEARPGHGPRRRKLTAADEVDADLIGWLRQAFDQAG